MNFGFSYIGCIYLLMLFVPNLIWTKHKPKDYDSYAAQENRLLLLLERAGEVLVSGSALIFSDFNLRPWTLWSLWLIFSLLLMILYEWYWIRYLRSEKMMQDFYSSLLGIPMPGAVLPIAAFLLLSVYGRNPILLIFTILLGIGHIGIHWNHRKELR